MIGRIKRFLLGAPLATHAEEHQRLNVPLGLAVFSSDALSSTAYATDEILLALAASTFAASGNLLSLPVALAISVLIAIVIISYRQIIRANPQGGGTYMVAKNNLGVVPSHIAAASLLIDYVLTVSVSITAGIAAITSTGILPHAQVTSLSIIAALIIMLMNLRGLKESGKAFAFPAYTFLFSMGALIFTGIYKAVTQEHVNLGSFTTSATHLTDTTGGDLINLTLILVLLKAFSHGCAGLTGIEAVADGVKAFQDPAPARANKTMAVMGILLISIFLSITFLAFSFHVMPKADETIISQVARAVFGGGTFFYMLVQFSTMILLVLAANTAFADFPRVASFLANDGYLPRQMMNLGDRLVYNNGIMLLSLLSIFLIWFFQGNTHSLIPLYAVGVFISFTLSQSGMVLHHRRVREPGWKQGAFINGFGAVITAFVSIILAFEKFTEGAWIIFVAIPLIMWMFRAIKRHYLSVARQLVLPEDSAYCPVGVEHTVLVLVSSLNRGTIPALQYAQSISGRVEAVHVKVNPQATERLQKAWEKWGCNMTLTILDSPYRSIHEPLLDYITEVEKRHEHDLVTIVIPEFVTKRWWHNLMHNQSAIFIKTLLRQQKGKVVTTVRYYLEE